MLHLFAQDLVGTLNVIDPMAYTFVTVSNMFVCFYANFVTMSNCWEDAHMADWLGPLPTEVRVPLWG